MATTKRNTKRKTIAKKSKSIKNKKSNNKKKKRSTSKKIHNQNKIKTKIRNKTKKSTVTKKEKSKRLKLPTKSTELNPSEIKKQRKMVLKDEHVRRYLIHHAGEHAIVIIQNLIQPMTDEELAKRLKVRVSEIRSTLNKLHALRLAEYSRTKDDETGWYTYKWSVRHANVMEITKVIEEEINKRMKTLPPVLYYCENCGDEAWTFDEAVEMEFKCPRCGTVLTEVDEKFKEKLKNLYLDF